MDIALDPQSQAFVDAAVQSGRFASPSEAVSEGLRLLREQEGAWSELRQSIQDAIARGGELSESELDEALDRVDERLAAAGL
jgi:antitoxin ParD1/3/4